MGARLIVLALLPACCDGGTGFPLDSVSFNGQPGYRVSAVFPTFHQAVGTPYSLTVSLQGWVLVFGQELSPVMTLSDYTC